MQKIETGSWHTAPREQIRLGAERVLINLNSENLLCQISQIQYGSIDRNHAHPQEQVSFILKGSCDFYVEGVPHRLLEGAWIVTPPNTMHYSVGLDPDRPLLILDVFSPSCRESVESYQTLLADLRRSRGE